MSTDLIIYTFLIGYMVAIITCIVIVTIELTKLITTIEGKEPKCPKSTRSAHKSCSTKRSASH